MTVLHDTGQVFLVAIGIVAALFAVFGWYRLRHHDEQISRPRPSTPQEDQPVRR